MIPSPTQILLDFSDSDLGELLDGAAIGEASPTAEAEPVAPSEELRDVSRRIASQYVPLVESFAGSLFARRAGPAAAHQLASALEALERLVEAAGDAAQAAAIRELISALRAFEGRIARGRGLERMSSQLRQWIPQFANFLQHDARQRLLAIVSYGNARPALLRELGAIPGIGPRRLERLYCAGLYTVEAVHDADPAEIAQVTGLPGPLAARVVEATRRFAEEERRHAARRLLENALEIRRLVSEGSCAPELLRLTREALATLEEALARCEKEER